LAKAEENDIILVTGSIFLIAEAKKRLTKKMIGGVE